MSKSRLRQALKGLILTAGLGVGIFAFGQTDALADTLTLTVEKNTIGQGMILDPVQVEFTKGESCADVVLRGMKEHNITPIYTWDSSYGFYLSGVKNCDSGSVNLPDCIKKVMTECKTWTGDSLELTANKYAPDLTEFSYCSASGWTYTLNDEFMGVGMGASYPSDGSVIRVMFALCGGADITGKDPNNGNKQIFEAANKSKLITLMGKVNADPARWAQGQGFNSAWAEANRVLNKLDASKNTVFEAVELLQSVEETLPPEVKVISLNEKETTLVKGDTCTLTASVVPSNAYQNISWKSSEPSVASVENGTVTALSEGTAVITARSSNGVSASCKVTVVGETPVVTPEVEKITLNKSSLTLTVGESAQKLTCTFSPAESNPELTWSSDNSAVAKVSSDGTVKPVSAGTTTVRVKASNGVSASCKVTVKESPKKLFLAGAPEITKCQASGKNVVLTWKAYDNADSYLILRRKPGEYKFTQIASTTKLTYTDTKAEAKTSYYYSVQAVSKKWGVKSGYNKNILVKTQAVVKAPGKTTLTVTPGKKKAYLKWKKATDAQGYIVYRSTSKNGTYKAIAAIKKGTIIKYTDKKVSSKRTYYYRVRAYRVVNGKKMYGSYSSVKAAKIK